MKPVTKAILIIVGVISIVATIGSVIYFNMTWEELTFVERPSNETAKANFSSQAINSTTPQLTLSETILQPYQEEAPNRTKRSIIFRPLFVYRQQQIKKQRYKEMREQQPQTSTTTTTQRPKYASGFAYGTSYYSPYRMSG